MSASLEYITINGTKIPMIFEEDKTLPIVSARFIFESSGSQSSFKPALARFSFRMLSEGTTKLDGVKFSEQLEQKAIKFSAGAGLETASVEFSSLKEHATFAAKSIADLFSSPNLSQSAFDKVRQQTLSSIVKKEDDFDYVAEDALRRIIFAATPMESSDIGSREQVEKLELSDVKRFLKESLALSRLIIVIGGDLSLDEAKKLSSTLLKPLNSGSMAKVGYYNAKDAQKPQRILKKTEQAYIYFGSPLHLKPTDPDAYKARVASFILGSSGFGSRLLETIRVKNALAYSAYSRHNLSKTNGYFSGHLQTKLVNEQKAIDLVRQTIEEYVKNGATQKELDSAKKFIAGSEPLRNETLNQRISRSFNEFYSGLGLGHSQKELASIENLSLQELNAFIAAHPEILQLSFAVVAAK